MNLVILTNILTPYRILLFEQLRCRVEKFTVLLLAEQEENRQWKLEKYRFRTEVLPGLHFKPRGYEISFHLNYGVCSTLRRLNPDVVLSGGFAPANIAALFYCKLFRKKFIGWGELTLRNDLEKSLIRKTIRKWMTSWSNASIASSSEAREAFIYYGAKEKEILTSIMPIDVDYFHKKTDEFRKLSESKVFGKQISRPVLLSVGRINRVKGYQELFKIYRQIKQVYKEVSLLIVGDGPDKSHYEKFVRENGLTDVHFTGFLQGNDLPKYLAIADIFVFHTLFDPFGAVLSEAMAAELPVVSSIHAAATQDLIEEGITGFKIDPKDTGSSTKIILKVLK
ncbi:MAG: glycosyltransferase, partial [Nitrospiria bacterium]